MYSQSQSSWCHTRQLLWSTCTTGWAQRPRAPLSTGMACIRCKHTIDGCLVHEVEHITQFKIQNSSLKLIQVQFWARPPTSCTVEYRQLKDCLEHCSCMIVREHYLTGRKRVSWPFVHTSAGIRYQTGIPSIDSNPHKACTCSPNGSCTLLVRFKWSRY